MRLLYITNESPLFPVGGIGTYIGYAAKAMAQAGHDVFLLTWAYGEPAPIESYEPFRRENTKILYLDGAAIWRRFPTGPYNHAASAYLAAEISRCVEDWNIDVVEAADYLSPALAFYQDFRTRSTKRDLLCVTYNHGFIEDFYDADQIAPTRDTQDDLVGERQQCRASDLVVTPSLAAMRRLAQYDIVDNVSLIREPFEFATAQPLHNVRHGITYIGRIALSKGIDKIIYFANLIDELAPVDSILLIGKCVNTPFKVSDIRQYVNMRLTPRLRDAVYFAGSIKRSAALNMLVPGSLSPSLGSAETFSYACIETIDHGLLPIVRHGTPMAEFFPDELQDYIFDEQFRDGARVRATFEKIVRDAPHVVRTLQDFNRVELSPARISGRMADQYDEGLRVKKGMRSLRMRWHATVDDVTIAIPAYKPGEIFTETIDSIAAQTTGSPQVLICNDGTPPEHESWFDYAEMRLPNYRVIKQPNAGLLGARNALIAQVETRLTVFVDADDILASTYLERTLEAYNHGADSPNAVLTYRLNFQESKERVIRDFTADHVHLIRNDFRMTALIETEILREIGFDTTRRNGEADDWVFWLSFAASGYCASMVPEFLFHYRSRIGSMSWPWSMGQTTGSQSMIRHALTEMVSRRPLRANALNRALHSAMVVHN